MAAFTRSPTKTFAQPIQRAEPLGSATLAPRPASPQRPLAGKPLKRTHALLRQTPAFRDTLIDHTWMLRGLGCSGRSVFVFNEQIKNPLLKGSGLRNAEQQGISFFKFIAEQKWMVMNELLQKVESWAGANNIMIFNGFNVSSKNGNIIVCQDEDPERYLEIALSNKINHIVTDKSIFDFEKAIDSILNNYFIKFGRDKEEVIDKFKHRLKVFKKYNDEIFEVTIEWQKEGFSYLFYQYADFYVEFIEEIEAIKTEQEGINLANQPSKIPQKEYDSLVETIASSDEYFRNHTQPGTKLDAIIEEIIENESDIDSEKYQIPIYVIKRDVEKVFSKNTMITKQKKPISKSSK